MRTWIAAADCAGEGSRWEALPLAVKVARCATCPVAGDCLAEGRRVVDDHLAAFHALSDQPRAAVWGGRTEAEIARELTAERRAAVA